MAKVSFYEKPGCGGNARQKALLQASGHELDVRDLLSEPWTPETLRPFFGTRPISAWFNSSSPRIKSGEIDPTSIGASKALALMIEDSLLIRRPLLQVGARRERGSSRTRSISGSAFPRCASPLTRPASRARKSA